MSEIQVTEQSVHKRPLDDEMLAMDVVDTLRHRVSVVERELNAEQRDQQLIERLREIYAAQGIEVPDHILAEGVTARQVLSQGDLNSAQTELNRLRELHDNLVQEYELRIVSAGSTGVWRVPNINEAARKYYIIVRPVTADGEVLDLPVTSEEDGETRRVGKWGLRVDEHTFEEVAADKKDDGMIQRNRFGIKKAGFLEPEYLIPTTGGTITSW